MVAAFLAAICRSLHGEGFGDLLFGYGGRIPRESLGVQNEFVVTPKGAPAAQGADIGENLGLRHIRSSFFFDESFLARENAVPDFSHFDSILASIPPHADLLPVLAYTPHWLADRADWKQVFVNRYVVPLLDRYGKDPRIVGWEIWNEPDGFCDGHVAPRGVLNCTAEDYVDLVARVAPEIRRRTAARIVGAATTSINQGYPRHLAFNRAMVDAGLLPLIDVYNFHWYGEQLEKLTLGGIADFLNGTGKRVWDTESNQRGSRRQLGNAQEVFSALENEIPGLERIYVFTYFDGLPPSRTLGLVASDGTESNLYEFLRGNR
jgi:hypothetical protein